MQRDHLNAVVFNDPGLFGPDPEVTFHKKAFPHSLQEGFNLNLITISRLSGLPLQIT